MYTYMCVYVFFSFFRKMQLQVKGDKLKEWNAKDRTEKTSFFKETSVEYKETKLP